MYYLDICHISGIFTVPVSGTWRVTYSLYSRVNSGDINSAYLYTNGDQVAESQHWTNSETGEVWSTGGREVTREFSQGDKIDLRTTSMDGEYWRINFCAEYVPKM